MECLARQHLYPLPIPERACHHMTCQLRSFLALALICITSTFGPAQNAQPVEGHPKIGLVLQGGGALGLAHVGVITWLEEHHIPILHRRHQHGRLSRRSLRDRTQCRRDAPDSERNPLGPGNGGAYAVRRPLVPPQGGRARLSQQPGIWIAQGLQFPAGFNSGQQVSLILDKIALPYSEIKSFNDLPTPFACVATDLVSGKPKVFRDGSLSLALRSTMSLPGIFTPVRTKDAIYADGGLLQNIPVEVAKAMGADLTLAIHLAEAPISPTGSLSSFAVLGDSISVMINANELRSMESADILVSVPLQKYNALNFDKADEIIKVGYDAAAAKAKVLLTLAVDDATWKQYLADRASRRRDQSRPDVCRSRRGEWSSFRNESKRKWPTW